MAQVASLFSRIASTIKSLAHISQDSKDTLEKVNALLANLESLPGEEEQARVHRPIPLQATLKSKGPIYLSVSDWVGCFENTGAPKNSFLVLLQTLGILSQVPLQPLPQSPALLPPAAPAAIATSSSKLHPGGSFPSAELFAHFMKKFQMCPVVLGEGVLCPYACDNQTLVCSNHTPFIPFLTGLAGKHFLLDGSVIRIAVPEDFVSLRIPTLDALAAARGALFNTGAFSSSIADLSAPASKEKSTPLLSLPSSAHPLHNQEQEDIASHIVSYLKGGSSLEVYLQPLINHPAWAYYPAPDVRGTPHFTHVLSAQCKDIRASVLSVLFCP